MNEKKKLDEANYFLSQMEINTDQIEIFEYNLSAFLSASRSVLQFAFEEVKNNNQREWYDDFINSSQLVKYFREKRNINIHKQPIKTTQRHENDATLKMPISHSIKKVGKNNNEELITDNCLDISCIKRNFSYEFKILFKNNNDDSVITLCKKYFNELSDFINEGINKKYFTE